MGGASAGKEHGKDDRSMAEVLNGYEIEKPFQNRDAGFSRWTTGRKDGNRFFLKEFLDPVWPAGTGLREDLCREAISVCRAYEDKWKRIYASANAFSDGTLVRTEEFFRRDSRYYIATEYVKGVDITIEEIAGLPGDVRRLLLLTAARGIEQLHTAGIVHADIKFSNLILQKTEAGYLRARLIDLGAAFFENEAPAGEDEIGGDQVYMAPETCRFLFGEQVELTCAIDVFAAGLLFHQLYTGHLPGFDRKECDYPHEAVLDGQELQVDPDMPSALGAVIRDMLAGDPAARPAMSRVCTAIRSCIDDLGDRRSDLRSPASAFRAAEDL